MQSHGSLTIRTFRVCRSTPAASEANSSARATDTKGETTGPSRQPTSGLPPHVNHHYIHLLAIGDIWNSQV